MLTIQHDNTYYKAIKKSGLSIYDSIEIGHPELWIPSNELEKLLNDSLSGFSVEGLPLRTRSKVIKEAVCIALGYPPPPSFKKTQPRFPGQNFDTYTQKSTNLQIWNEDISPTRRYVIIEIKDTDSIGRVRVVTGDSLEKYDTTGKLTQKYQARLNPGVDACELISGEDTETLVNAETFCQGDCDFESASPVANPEKGKLIPIAEVYEKLQPIVGMAIEDAGVDQERNRGAELHRLICKHLGYSSYVDNGQFPDIRHQLVEVKLQTSPTIDLGLVTPDSESSLDVTRINGVQFRHCDVRYAIFSGTTNGSEVTIDGFYLTSGEDFFDRFPQFQGKVLNKKIQMHLPTDFFE